MKLMVRSGPMVMRLTREAPGRRPGFMGLLSFEGTRIEIGCRRSRKACQDAAWCENLSEIGLTAKQTPLIPAPAFRGDELQRESRGHKRVHARLRRAMDWVPAFAGTSGREHLGMLRNKRCEF